MIVQNGTHDKFNSYRRGLRPSNIFCVIYI